MTWARVSGIPTGVGLGLRWAFLEPIVRADQPVGIPFFEVSPENYMRRGDRIPSALEQVFQRTPVVTHGLMLNIGSTDPLDRAYLDQLRDFLRHVGAKYHSDHLCWSGGRGRILHDLLPLPLDQRLVHHVADRIRRVQDHLGVPMAMENISYYYSPRAGMPEADFIRAVVETADCGLMLDVNNLWVNAQNHGFDPWAYLDALPLERVVQMHVAGGERRAQMDDLVIDTHGADVEPTVRELMAAVVERIGAVPVVYERDHNIPPLAELVRQVAELGTVYEAALARHPSARERLQPQPPARATSPFVLDEMGHLSLEGGLIELITSHDAPLLLEHGVSSTLSRWGIAGDTGKDLAGLTPERLLVYRSLVRNGLAGTIRDFLPRTLGRMGDERFSQAFGRWLAEGGAVSPYLRDVPTEFARWLQRAWADGEQGPAYLGDLAVHEVVEAEVEAAPQGPHRPIEAPELRLDAPVAFDQSTRVVDYGHRIHDLPVDVTDRTEPVAEPTTLLVYRDQNLAARFLLLTPLARAVILALWQQGQPLSDGIRAGAAQVGASVDDALLARLAQLFADLADRGVLLGAAKM